MLVILAFLNISAKKSDLFIYLLINQLLLLDIPVAALARSRHRLSPTVPVLRQEEHCHGKLCSEYDYA